MPATVLKRNGPNYYEAGGELLKQPTRGSARAAARSATMVYKHVMSPLECYLEIYAHRQTAHDLRKTAKHREDQITAEADLVHFQNHLKECTGVGEVVSGLSDKEMRALRAFFEMTCGYGWLRRGGWIGRAPSRKEKQIPFFAIDPANWCGSVGSLFF